MATNERRNASHLMHLVHRLRGHGMRSSQGLEGLHPGQPPVLFCLRTREDISQRELAAALGLTAASMTVTLRRMEKAGLVERNTDLGDKRVQRVKITEQGLMACRRAWESMCQLDDEMFRGFSEEEIAALSQMLSRCADNLVRATGKLNPGDDIYEEYIRHVGPFPPGALSEEEESDC